MINVGLKLENQTFFLKKSYNQGQSIILQFPSIIVGLNPVLIQPLHGRVRTIGDSFFFQAIFQEEKKSEKKEETNLLEYELNIMLEEKKYNMPHADMVHSNMKSLYQTKHCS